MLPVTYNLFMSLSDEIQRDLRKGIMYSPGFMALSVANQEIARIVPVEIKQQR